MALTFQDRVHDYVGAITDTGGLSEWLTAGARRVLELIPKEKAQRHMVPLTIPDVGTSVTNYRVFDVVKSGFRARPIGPGMVAQAVLAGSLHQATTRDPAYAVSGGVLKVYPTSGGGIAEAIAFPQVWFSQSIISEFPKEAEDLVILYAAIQYLAASLSNHKADIDAILPAWPIPPAVPLVTPVSYTDAMGRTVGTVAVGPFGALPVYTPPSLTLPAPPGDAVAASQLPVAPTLPAIAYTDALYLAAQSVSVGSFGTVPAFTVPVLSLTAVPADVSINQSLPVAPDVPVFAYGTAASSAATTVTVGPLGTAPTYTSPSVSFTPAPPDVSIVSSLPSAPAAPVFNTGSAAASTVGVVTVGALGTQPTYTAPAIAFTPPPADVSITLSVPTAPSPPVLNFDQATAATVTAVTVGALGTPPTYLPPTAPTWPSAPTPYSPGISPPSPPVAPSYSYTDATGSTVAATTVDEQIFGTAPVYQFVLSASFPTYSTTAVAPTVPVMPSFSTVAFTDLGLPAPPLMDLAAHFDEVNNVTTGYLKGEEDVELAVAKLQEIQARIEDWRLKYIDDALTRLRADRDRTAQLQIQQAQIKLQKELEEFGGILKRYEVAMVGYRSQVEADLGVFRERTALYNVDVQKEVQRSQQAYMADLSIYQVNVQRAITDAQFAQQKALRDAELTTDLNLKNEAQELAAKAGLYEAQLRKYATEIEGYVGQIRGETDAYTSSVNGYVGTIQGLASQYASEVQAARTAYEATLSTYQATLTKEIENARIAAQDAQLEAQLATDVSKQNSLQRLQRDIEQYRGNVEVYKAQLEGYMTGINAQVAVFQTNYRKWEIARQTEIAKYNGDLQNALNEFNQDAVIYQSTVSSAIEDARIAASKAQADAQLATDVSKQNALQILSKDVQEYAAKLEAYKTQMQGYMTEVNAQVSVFQTNYRKWEVARQTEIAKFQADMQDALNKFNKELAVYQSSITTAVQDAEMASRKALQDAAATTDVSKQNALQQLAKDVQEYQSKLARYQTAMAGYQAAINADVAVFTANLRKWEVQRDADIRRYLAEVQLETDRFGGSLAVYQTTVQKAVVDAQLASAKALQDAQLASSAAVQNERESVASAIAVHQLRLQQYSGELEGYRTSVQSTVELYRTNVQKWETERSTLLGKYAQEVQSAAKEFERSAIVYQASIQKAITDSQIAAQKAETDARLAAETDMGNRAQQVATAVKNQEIVLQRYLLEIQSYGGQVQKVGAEVQVAMAKAQAKYEMDMGKLKALQSQYDQGLQLYVGGLTVDSTANAGNGQNIVPGRN